MVDWNCFSKNRFSLRITFTYYLLFHSIIVSVFTNEYKHEYEDEYQQGSQLYGEEEESEGNMENSRINRSGR